MNKYSETEAKRADFQLNRVSENGSGRVQRGCCVHCRFQIHDAIKKSSRFSHRSC